MSLKLILGPSGSGKSRMLFETALQSAGKNAGSQYFVLVPEQFTMQTQQELCRLSPVGGVLNIDILSFSRLAVRVFGETGVRKKTLLKETGKILLLRLIADRESSGLSLLSGAVDRPGVLSELKSILSEMDQYEITDQDISSMIKSCQGRPVLAGKLSQLQVLREKYREFQAEHGLETQETIPQALCARIPQSKMLEGSSIFLDGYTGFTPAQLDVLSALMRKASSVTVTVTLDADESLTGRISEDDLFALSRKTIKSLFQIAEETGTAVEEPLIIDPQREGGRGRFHSGSDIGYLERNLFRRGRRLPKQSKTGKGAVRILSCAHPREEAKACTAIIRQVTRNKGIRYRDITVIASDLGTYSEYLRRAFTKARIPFFIDRSVPVTLNPAFEFVKAAFAILDSGFSYETVMAFFRTGFVFEKAETADLVENYILAAGVRGRRRFEQEWTQAAGGFSEEDLTELNLIRTEFMERFEPFADVCRRSSAKLTDYARAMWVMLDAFDVQRKLLDLAKERSDRGEAAEAEVYSHASSVIASVLDEAVALLGDETVSRSQFEQILEAGFSEARIGIIPPETDQVHIGDLTRSRITDAKVLLLIGMNDDFITASSSHASVLTEMERDFLSQNDFHLAPTAKEEAAIQKFYIYLMLSKPDDLLVLSFSRMGADGKVMRPAPVLRQVKALLPLVQVEEGIPGGRRSQVYLPDEAVEALAGEIAESRTWSLGEREQKLPYLRQLCLTASMAAPDHTRQLLSSLMPKKIPCLSRDIARGLYGDVLEGSVSRLETFAECPFQQYAIYGLGLQERSTYKVQMTDVGQVMHRAMELIARRVKESRDYTWAAIPEEVLDDWARDSLKEAALELAAGKFTDTFRSAGQYRRLLHILQHCVSVMRIQLAAGDFLPSLFEVRFDSENEMTARPLVFEDGSHMQLTGRIDRIDESEDRGKGVVYVKIIDYKTGSASFSLQDLYMGTNLQLVTYMDAASAIMKKMHRGERIVCAGILCFHMKDPVLSAESADKDTDQILMERIKKLKPDGLILRDREVISRLSLDPSRLPEVVPVTLKMDGTIYEARSSLADEKQMELLSRFVRIRMRQAGESIRSGVIAPSPIWKNENENACSYCLVREVCRYVPHDPVLKSREPVSESKEEIWDKIRRETEDGEG